MIVIDGIFEGALDFLNLPYQAAAVFLFAYHVAIVARAAERGMAQQLTGIFVVGHTDGYAALRHTTLEGIEILAMWGIKLIETDERLAGRYLQEILVLVVG